MSDTSSITNQQAIEAWPTAPDELAESFGDEGDFARQHLLNPALFSLLGDVAESTSSMLAVVRAT